MKTTQIDENEGDLGGAACWGMTGVPGRAPDSP